MPFNNMFLPKWNMPNELYKMFNKQRNMFMTNMFGNRQMGIQGLFQPQIPITITQNPIASSVFTNQDINGFAQIIKAKGQASPDSLFARANDEDINILFNSIDTNGNGRIDENEAQAIFAFDGDETSLSDEDFVSLCTEIQQNIYEKNSKQVEQDRLAAQQAYQNQYGGANYQNYGSRMSNGSVLSSNEQYSIKKKLEDIENEQIPKLESEKDKIQEENNKYVKEQNENINKLLQEKDKSLGDLDDKYKEKQNEIDECDKKIREAEASITEKNKSIHKSNSIIANLEAELANLKTDTANAEVNAQNTKRKEEINQQIMAEKENIKQAESAIKEAEEKKAEQEKLKATKNEELKGIEAKIKAVEPKVVEEIDKIKTAIEDSKKKAKDAIKAIDEKIQVLQAEAIKCQKDLGERAGKAASMTGSEVVKRALEIAQAELGTRESGKNNGAVCKYRNGVANSAPWCASFVSYLYGAGQGSDNGATFGYQPSVSGIMNRAAQAGFYSPKGSYTPQPGDIVIMKNGCSHTAIVESVDANGAVTTIGGNEGGAVRRRTYQPGSRGYGRITGFVRMNEWQGMVS